MVNYAVSYAQALYSLATEEGKAEKIMNDLEGVCLCLGENEAYVKLINAPDIVFEEKEKLLDEAFGASVDKYVLNVLKLLAKNRLFNITADLKSEYEKSYNIDENIEKATVISAREISAPLKEKLVCKLSEMTGKKVVIEYTTDEKVIGGLVIRFTNTQIDASVKNRLEALKERLSAI